MVNGLPHGTAAPAAGLTRREIREAERRAALAAEAGAQQASAVQTASRASQVETPAAPAPLAFESRRARRLAERPIDSDAVRETAAPASKRPVRATRPVAVAQPIESAPLENATLDTASVETALHGQETSTATTPVTRPNGAPLTRTTLRREATTERQGEAQVASPTPPVAPARAADARTLPAVVIPAAVASTPAITPVAELARNADDVEPSSRDIELPLSFRRNQAALQPVKADRRGSKRAFVRVKREKQTRAERRGTIVRGAAGFTALSFAATVAVATTLPAVADNSGEQAEESADAVINQAGGAQSLTVGAASSEVSTASTSLGDRAPAYSVATMGTATAYNTTFGVPRPDPNAYANNLTAPVQWPFPTGVIISDHFGDRVAPCSGCSSDHKGVDFTPGEGTPIGSVAAGRVLTVQETDAGGLGVHVTVEHIINGERVVSVYGHMLTGSITVQVGDTVKVGDEVGKVGNTGSSTGAHLHLEIHVNDVPIDPYAYLAANNTSDAIVDRPSDAVEA